METASRGSAPWIAAKTNPQSSALRQIGPMVSSDQQSCMHPCRLTRPEVGRSPTVPQRIDGWIMLPPVPSAIEKPTSPAAIAEPEPDDEPAASKCGFQG